MRKKLLVKLTVFAFILLSVLTFGTSFSYAASLSGEEGLGCGAEFGPFADVFCKKDNQSKGADFLGGLFNDFVSKILGFLTIIAALYFMFQFVTAGIAWVGAGGDKNNIEQARSKIMNAILGLVIVASAWVIIGIIGNFVGIKILDPGSMIPDLQIYPTGPK